MTQRWIQVRWNQSERTHGGTSVTWNGGPAWDGSGDVMTMRPAGDGTLAAGAVTGFGFTVMANGEWSAPAVGPCTAA